MRKNGINVCGKAASLTTTATRHAASLIRLDRPAPTVLGAVKRAVDADPRPGRFLLTGSVRADIEADTWPGTGRVVRVGMLPMTVGERLKRMTRPLVDRVMDGDTLAPATPTTDLRGYIELALQGGFPEMLNLSERGRWLRDRLGDRFIAGIILHTGPASFPLSDRITAAPISTLWA